jgi:hypothetical protein
LILNYIIYKSNKLTYMTVDLMLDIIVHHRIFDVLSGITLFKNTKKNLQQRETEV